jgi:hypothetical protein
MIGIGKMPRALSTRAWNSGMDEFFRPRISRGKTAEIGYVNSSGIFIFYVPVIVTYLEVFECLHALKGQ